ncbi:hypothetical protein AAV94_00510 [Lampropedia cohaerens]|uniref:TonB-dependent receptor n=1 Tax=Lampropedia cohaerens TaxID=1610491 RepID=A0A0U1Q3B8_9BURK|nr:hypothetical protein AAV94_00510 [Lampropedia cohaerens]
MLANSPGITFNSGEGAGGVGDGINIRGFNSGEYGGSNVFRDGVRESAYYTRSEMFNVEQVEVVKGSSASVWGAGLIGGGINLVTKTPFMANRREVNLGLGTSDFRRATVDLNQIVDEERGIAVRLNAVAHRSGVDGRDEILRKRWGIAPSIAYGLGTPTRLTLSYEHLNDDGNYDYGIPTLHDGKNPRQSGGRPSPYPGVKWSGYFGYDNLDKEDNKIDRLNFKAEHNFNERVTLVNQLSLAQMDRDYVVTTPGGDQVTNQGPVLRRLTGIARHTENKTISNQTNLLLNFETGSVGHDMVVGAEFTREKLDLMQGGLKFGNQGNNHVIDPANPPKDFVGDTSVYYTSSQSTRATSKALYVLDTLRFNEQWQTQIALRHDWWDVKQTHNASRGGYTSGTPGDKPWADGALGRDSQNLFTGRVGLIYKPAQNGTIYATYANARQPTSIQAATSGGAGDVNPVVKGDTVELGTKWDLFDERLSLTAAIYRTTQDKPEYVNEELQDELYRYKQRVTGLELGAAGNITPQWSVFAGYSYMDSEITDSDKPAGNLNNGNLNGDEAGIAMRNTPKHAASLWTSYRVTPQLNVSYGLRYVGSRYIALGRGAGMTSQYRVDVPSYTVHNMMLSYQVSDALGVQLNINNLFDKKYWRQYNGHGFGVPGAGRGAQLLATYQF